MTVARMLPRSGRFDTPLSARQVQQIRRALDMNQRDFAFYLRVAVNTVSAWENDRRHPSQLAEAAIRNLAATYGVDLRRFGA